MRKGFVFSFIFAVIVFSLVVSVSNIYSAEKYELYIAQGIEKINEKQYLEAVEVLKKAINLSPDNPEAGFYSAIAYSRSGNLEMAEKLFLKIKDDKEYAADVYLELGRISYVRKECRKAKNYLRTFQSLSLDKDKKGYADRLIENCSPDTAKDKPYRLSLSLGAKYDSNVVLEASNPSILVDRKRDTRAVVSVAAGARILKTDNFNAKLDYSFYHSAHAHLTNYNLHYHKISPRLELNVSDIMTPSAGYKFEYINLGDARYGELQTLFAKLNIKEDNNFSTDLTYEYGFNHYFITNDFTTNSDRSGHHNQAGIQQNFRSGKFKADIHLSYKDLSAKKSFWSYRSPKIGGAVSYRVIKPVILKLTADFRRRRHRNDHPAYSETRIDNMQKYGLSIRYIINKRFMATLSEQYTRNDSNISVYDYERNTVGLFFTYRVI